MPLASSGTIRRAAKGGANRHARTDSESRCKSKGFLHGTWVCLALPSNLECRPVIGARSDDRYTERHIDRRIEGDEFQRDESLIVVQRDDEIVSPQKRIAEHSIR
jgi:hypothetical protein